MPNEELYVDEKKSIIGGTVDERENSSASCHIQ